MKKNLLNAVVCLMLVLFLQQHASASTDSIPIAKTYRVGVFAPLYLDSVFSETGSIKYRDGMPKLIASSVDFVNGVQVALDSMQGLNDNIETTIYDTKSYKEPLTVIISNHKLDKLDLIIGSVKDADYKQLADLALAKNIPFISATYPNDGGVTRNPFVLVVNSTLKAHCEAIYSFLLQSHGTDKIFLCRKKGAQEDKVAAYFKAINEQDGRALLNIQTLNFDSTISPDFLKTKLDSNRQSVMIGASLDESFAFDLATACNTLHDHYPLTLIGMPNWDAFKAFTKKGSLENFPIYFTSPYFNTKTDSSSRQLMDAFTQKTKGKPSDVAFKGYECARLFVKLLTLYPNDFMSHLNEKSLKVFSDYNFRPVMKKGSTVPDYFENKHLYFIKLLNGSVTKAW
jgi:hypothetical protein